MKSCHSGVKHSSTAPTQSTWGRRDLRRIIAAGATCFALLNGGQVSADAGFEEALRSGKVGVALRLRYESAEQDNALEDADALTLRTALGYTTGTWKNLTAFVEFETVSALIDDYSGAPPPVQYSIIPDPDDSEVNQWGIRYTGIKGLTATVGRSMWVLDNARWVGNVGWRQNMQTYDGVFLKYAGIQDVTLQAAYLSNVNDIFFNNIDLDAQILNASWAAAPWLTVTGYGYFLDFESITANTPDADTFGVRATGSLDVGPAKLAYSLEYAGQDGESVAGDYDADYRYGDVAVTLSGVTLKIGEEVLGSDDGVYAVRTPLATLHAFNGWTDTFLFTPATGLEDTFVSLGGKIEKVNLLAVYHDFQADEGNADYGTEWGAQATRPIVSRLVGGIKYSQYDADQFSVDTDRLWVWLQYAF